MPNPKARWPTGLRDVNKVRIDEGGRVRIHRAQRDQHGITSTDPSVGESNGSVAKRQVVMSIGGS
jgi:hypothetical protein